MIGGHATIAPPRDHLMMPTVVGAHQVPGSSRDRGSVSDAEPPQRSAGQYGRGVDAPREPVPFEVYQVGVFLHGSKASLAVGDLLVPGRESNFENGRTMNYVYFTATLDAAVWGAELASGEGRGRVYLVEPTGPFEDDPNLTDKKFPGNPTQSFRSRAPLRVVGELTDWVGHPAAQLQAMRDSIEALRRRGAAHIED